MSLRCTECGQPMDAVPAGASLRPPSASMRPTPTQCDWCRKIAVAGKVGVGASTFKGPDDAIVKATGEGTLTHLIVRADPPAGRSERLVFRVHAALAALVLIGVAARPSLLLPSVVVSAVILLSGMWLARIVGARSEFVVDGPHFSARGWRGGAVKSSPRDVREVRIEGKGPSVEHGRARTAYDVVISLDDGTSHTVATQFRRYEYAEETVRRLKDGIARATVRG